MLVLFVGLGYRKAHGAAGGKTHGARLAPGARRRSAVCPCQVGVHWNPAAAHLLPIAQGAAAHPEQAIAVAPAGRA